MSLVLQLQDVSFTYPTQLDPLFEGVSFSLYQGDKAALLGTNGCGKSTLLTLIEGAFEFDGVIHRPSQLTVIRQEDSLDGTDSVLDALLVAYPEVYQCYQRMQAMEAKGIPEPMPYATTVQEFSDLGGYHLLQEIERLVSQIGYADVLTRPVLSLSGGERRLLKLLAALLYAPELLLLDEPSNYLDTEASMLLVEQLKHYAGALLIVSHDRWLLDQVVTQVYQLKHRKLTAYKGNYSTYKATLEADFKYKQRHKERLETEIVKLEETARNYQIWGGRKEKEKSGALDKGFIGARAARLQKRRILAKTRLEDNIETLAKSKPWIDKHYEIAFERADVPSGTCLSVRELSFSHANKQVIQQVSLTLAWGERLLLGGGNGSGKTTLVRLLLKELTPEQGEVLWSPRARIAYLPQHSVLETGRVADVFEDADHDQARTLLGSLHVKGDLFYQQTETLSLGQQRKLALVRMILAKPNIIILDEPTTHLDVESVEMLEKALLAYQGTVIMVSHDRYLNERLTTQVLELDSGRPGSITTDKTRTSTIKVGAAS